MIKMASLSVSMIMQLEQIPLDIRCLQDVANIWKI